MVVVHDLLKYRYMDDVTANLISLFCSTSYREVFKMLVRLFRIKQVKALRIGLPAARVLTSLFLPYFDVICDILLINRRTAKWNLFVLYNDQKKKDRCTYTFLTPIDCWTICASN